MPNLSVSVASLLSALNVGGLASPFAPEKTGANGADTFSALLDIGKASANDASSQDDQQKNDDANTPVAAHVDAPREQPASRPDRRDDAPRQVDGQRTDKAGKSDAPEKITASNRSDASQEKPAAKTAEPKNAGGASDAAAAKTAPSSANDNTSKDSRADIAREEQDLRDKLQAQLGDISQILLSILQAAGVAANAATDGANNAGVALPTDGAVDANASGVDLLKQIGAIVQQLQALLKSDGKQTVDATAGTDSDANALVNLTGSLQADVTRLSQLVQQNKSADLAPSLALLRPQSDDQTLSADEIKAVLKNAIAQVKEGLQQLRGDNEKFFADARAAFDAAAQANAPIAAKDVVLAFKNVIQPETKISASNEDALPVVAAAVATPALNPIVTPQATILNGLPVAAIQGNTNNSANDSGSGNNQGQGASTGNATPLASQLSAPDAAAKSDFAKALDRARLPVLDQVVFNIKKATADGSSKISIQLDPMELGKLEIKLHVGGDGKTAVVVTADNKNTLDLLQRDAQGLMRALNDAGLQADSGSLSFNLRGGDGQGGQNSERSQAANTYKKIQPDDEADIALNAISRSYTVTLADGLDIKI